jgi:hypothetical protein
MSKQPVTVICSYRVKQGSLEPFKALLEKHWPTLRELGLATEREPLFYVGDDEGKGPHVVEIFEWSDEEAPGLAHASPEVMAVWEPMGALVEGRGENRPAMDFPHFKAFEL